MRSPKHQSPTVLLMAVVLVSGGFLLQPRASLAASAYQLQADTKIHVESFKTAETTVLPINHADFAAQLTEAVRQQLDDENRLQTDLRLPALKLVGAIVSYRDSLLNVQVELYDGKQYLAYSRVERQLDPDGDWKEDGELMAEQLLDELMSQIKQPPEQVINLPVSDCHGYRPTTDCNDIDRRDWGWWRQGADEHRDHGAKPPRPAVKHPPHDEHPGHEHDDRHVAGEHRRHPHEKHHWITDEQMDHHHKSPRIEGAVSERTHPRREVETAVKTDGQITLPEDSGSPTKAGSPIGNSAESGQHSPDVKRPHRESQREDEARNSGHAEHVEQPFNTTLQPKAEVPHSAADQAQPTDTGIKSLKPDHSALPTVDKNRLAEPVRQPAIADAVSSPVEHTAPVLDAVAPGASRSIGTAINNEDSLSTPIPSDSTTRISPASSTGYSSDSATASGGSSVSSTSGSSDNGSTSSRSFTAAPSSSSSSGYSSSDSTAAAGAPSSSATSFSSGSGSSASSVSSAPSASSSDESTPSISPTSSPSPQTSAPPVSVPTPSPVAAPEPAKPEPEKPAQPASNPNGVKP